MPSRTAIELAQTGQAATRSIQSSPSNTSLTVLYADQIEDFNETYDRCNGIERDCVMRPRDADDNELLQSRNEYRSKFAIRLKALSNLAYAYEAMEYSAETDSRAEVEGAIGNLVD